MNLCCKMRRLFTAYIKMPLKINCQNLFDKAPISEAVTKEHLDEFKDLKIQVLIKAELLLLML